MSLFSLIARLFRSENKLEDDGEPSSQTSIDIRGNWQYEQAIVGEAQYQDNIAQVAGPKQEEGYDLKVIAHLVCENDNAYDKYAVAVLIDGLKVGYLARDDARAYRQELKKFDASLSAQRCRAQIVGGWLRGRSSEGHYGVVLDVVRPIKRVERRNK